MGASRCCRSAWSLVVLGLALSRAAAAEERSRAELTTLLDSGNLLNDAAAEPAPWEALGSARTGRDNRAWLTLAGAEAGFLPGLSTHALLRLELGLTGLGEGRTATLRDASSSVGLAWQLTSGPLLTLDAFPFDTDYVRLGYLHALDWGGTQVAARESVFLGQTSGAPGLRLGLSSPRIQLFSGLKWAAASDALAGPRRLWGVFGGGSFALAPTLRAELGFGFFQRRPGFLEGASLRWVWHGTAAEPEMTAEPFRPPSLRQDAARLEAEAPPGLALALEGVVLVSRQQQLVTAPAGALYGSARGRVFAGHAALTWRSLAFVLRNDSRFSPDEDADGAAQRAELGAWLGGSIALLALHLVPSLEVGARLPAALSTPSDWPGVAQTWVAGGSAGLEPLPLGSGRLPLLAARLAARWQISTALATSVTCDYQRNPNRVRLAQFGSLAMRVFDSADTLALLGALQARW